MNTDLLRVSLRQQAVFISKEQIIAEREEINATTLSLVGNLRRLGYTVSENLLTAINHMNPMDKCDLFELLGEVKGINLNWAPLVKEWDVPTGESLLDHIVTLFANAIYTHKGTRLACGHLIPEETFPLERYNGCPFCGKPFEFGKIENFGQGSKLNVLELWTEKELNNYFVNLLESRTALDATQVDSLKILLRELPLPEVNVSMKETTVLIIDSLVEKNEIEKAQVYFNNPNDILRYLWYTQTDYMQLIEPKTIINRFARNHTHVWVALNRKKEARQKMKTELKLKYTRAECRIAATWLNKLDMEPEKACEIMHPKRGMWVRIIRALRLAEYAKKPGFERLQNLMDVFYNETYPVVKGEMETARLKMDMETTFALLKQRPGLFARSLFANMLWFGADDTLNAFKEVIDKVPARLVFTLNMHAQHYFKRHQIRIVRPLGETPITIKPNRLINLHTDEQLEEMIRKIKELCLTAVFKRFTDIPTESQTMYIDPMLFNIPLAIGDRSETIQDTSCALMGTKFPVEGNSVRLFMQWGKGLPAQHLDMDLSAQIIMKDYVSYCSFYHLVAPGAKHSGDIQRIPDMIGTAEYIELDLNELAVEKAKYVLFTCNAYSRGALSPNLVVGWMNSANPMRISDETGVAYDPSCVQHQVRVSQNLTKGLLFGILDVQAREIIWMEIPFDGQLVNNLSFQKVEALLARLKSKTTIGELLSMKAKAQHIELVETPEADEVYSMEWAIDTAAVTKLLFD
ncbi:hypothetical protein [Parabacteroides sp. PF5-9]|uniref:hypothetical protein n=1 Tax=Parabacteroides sp. PF5-9 TaxID=1742404 RepID=UPI002476FACA|nr:hypothetical protein [Parabacteroides sp. PF5-9]MDH6358375.1 hypothetical protein [Parabacteroides sp. PF5-9]